MFEFHHVFAHKILMLVFDKDHKKLEIHLNLHIYPIEEKKKLLN